MRLLIIISFVFCTRLSSIAQEINATKINEISADTFQHLLPFDTTRAKVQQMVSQKIAQKLNDSLALLSQGIPFKNIFRYDFYGTAAAISLINKPDNTEKGNLQLYYNATINNRLIIDKFSWSFSYLMNMGIKNTLIVWVSKMKTIIPCAIPSNGIYIKRS